MSDLNSRDELLSDEVGIMAELGKFEVEFTMYGCAYYENGKVLYLLSENAEKVYDFMYDINNAEKLPTNIQSTSIRSLVPSGAEPYILDNVRTQLLDKLFSIYDEKYFSVLFELQNVLRNNEAYEILKELQYQFDGICTQEQLQLFRGLVETAYCQKKLWTKSYMELLEWIEWTKRDLEQELMRTDLYAKTFYGFAYLKENEKIKVYVDGYKNNIYKRIEQMRMEGYEVSNIIKKTYWYNNNYTVVQAKKDCQHSYVELFGEWYADVLWKIKQIMSPVSRYDFDNILRIMVNEENDTLLQSLTRQGAIWNIL